MSHKVNLVRVFTAATGNSSPITLGAAYSQLFMTPAEAGAMNGRVYTYLIVDGNDWEMGRGAYTSSGTSLARTTVLASRISGTLGTSRITLTGTAQVRFIESAEDMDGIRGTRAVTGTSDVMANSDQGYAVTYSNGSAVAVSLGQPSISNLFIDGWATTVQNLGAGAVTITPASSTINGSATLVLAQNMGAYIWSDGSNYHAYFIPVTKPALAGNNLADVNAAAARGNLGGTTVGQALFTAVDEYGARLKLSVLSMPQGRLTLASGVPVMTTAQTDKTTIYYTPFVGNQIPVKDPSLGVMGMATFAELSTTTTDTTNNPAAIGASKVNDWFVWRDGSTMRLCHGPDWTNDTTRSAGTALTMANGVLVNNADITNGPLAGYGTYVGTTRSDVSNKLNWRYGTSGTASFKFADFSVWNAYNRRDVTDWFADTTSSYTYSGSVRAAHGTASYSVFFVVGLVEDAIEGGYACYAGQAANPVGAIGLGLNTTAAFSAPPCSVPAFNDTRMSTIRAMPQLGYNQLSALEASGAAQTLTVQSAGSSNYVGGLSFRGRA